MPEQFSNAALSDMWLLHIKLLSSLNCFYSPLYGSKHKVLTYFPCARGFCWSCLHVLEEETSLREIESGSHHSLLICACLIDHCRVPWAEIWGGGTALLGASTKKPSTTGSTNPAPVMCYSAVEKCSPGCGCLIQLSCFSQHSLWL